MQISRIIIRNIASSKKQSNGRNSNLRIMAQIRIANKLASDLIYQRMPSP
jgi:hypothetical protein